MIELFANFIVPIAIVVAFSALVGGAVMRRFA
jgi:hypothetical protein